MQARDGELKKMISIEGSMHEISAKCRMELSVMNGSRAPWKNEEKKTLIRCSKDKQQQEKTTTSATTTTMKAVATDIQLHNAKAPYLHSAHRVIANTNSRLLRIISMQNINRHCIVVVVVAADMHY